MIESAPRALTASEIAGLWEIFAAINETWELFHTRDPAHPVKDASNLRSTWLEFIGLRADSGDSPSYVGEYDNALAVASRLKAKAGDQPVHIALKPLLFAPGDAPTPLANAKHYVVDEFISVMVVASGFKEFGGRNYDGFLGGSRFNRVTRVVTPVPVSPRGGRP